MEVFPFLRLCKYPCVFMACLLTHCSFQHEECAGAHPPLPALLLPHYSITCCPFERQSAREVALGAHKTYQQTYLSLSLSLSPFLSPCSKSDFTFLSYHFHFPPLEPMLTSPSWVVRNNMLNPVSFSFHYLCCTCIVWEILSNLCFSQKRDPFPQGRSLGFSDYGRVIFSFWFKALSTNLQD